MARGKTYTAAQEAALRALRDDHPTETYVEVAIRARDYGMVEGKTIEQIADKLSRMYLLEKRAAEMQVLEAQPEETQMQLIVTDPKTDLLARIADTLDRIYALLIKEE